MTMVKIQLVGCERFNVKNELYEKGKVYMVRDAKAELLLRKKDDFDRPYFTEYKAPTKTKRQRIAEAVAAAEASVAAAVAESDEVIDRTADVASGELMPVVDPDAAVVVDTDDDESLDDDDETHPDEVKEDRDDGKAVEV